MKQAGSENFPVAGMALGRRYRDHLLAIYGFARLVDDTGDEAPGDRTALLDRVDAELSCIYAGQTPEHPVMRTLAASVHSCGLPEAPLRRLVAANRRDQVVTRYQNFGELMAYCQLSAAPVGELVLHVYGQATPARIELSDRVCSALQIIEHLQDVGEDYRRGRVYLPADALAAAGCHEAELSAPSASPALRAAVADLAQNSRRLLAAGTPLTHGLPLRPRLAIAGFVAGGRATLVALERARYDVLARRPRRTTAGFAVSLVRVVSGR